MKQLLQITLLLTISLCYAQQIDIEGTVVEAKNDVPIPNVNITIKGKAKGVAADFDGNFKLKNVATSDILVISTIGFKTLEIPVNGQTSFQIKMEADVSTLDQVVLIGYQKKKRRDVNGAVSSIQADAIEGIPVLNISSILSTQVTGLQTATLSGAPGARGAIVIRGNTSIGSDINADLAYSNPLYVIDGVQTNLEDLADYGQSNLDYLSSLNPDDIQSIDVLQDAAAAAIYGSRGANGVIIIETKKGQALDKPEFSYGTSVGIQPLPELIPILTGNAERRAKINMINQWWSTDRRQGVGLPMVLTDSLNPAFNNNVDYQGLFYRTGITQKHNFSVRGGGDKSNYRFSLGYDNQEGNVKATGLKRITFASNVNFKPGKSFKDQLIARFTYTDRATGQGPDIRKTLPVNPAELESSLFRITDKRIASLEGELSDRLNTDRKTSFTISNFAQLNLFSGLVFNSQLSYVYESNKINSYVPSTIRTEGNGQASYRLNNRVNLSADNYLSYSSTFGTNHTVSAVAGTRVDYNQYETLGISAVGGSIDAIKVINNRYAQDDISGSSNITENALLSFYGRIGYRFKNRYQADFTYGIDGSSKFGPEVRYARFPAASVGWIISDEPFWEKAKLKGVVNFLKFRASWGINGNQPGQQDAQYGPYRLGYGGTPYWANQNPVKTYAGISGVTPIYTRIANRRLTWEESEQWNVGADLSMFDSRLNINFSAYHKNTDQLSFQANLPYYSGYNSANANIAGVLNYGWEATIRYDVFPRTSDWRLELMAGFARNKNYVTKLPNGNRDFIGSDYGYVVGRPLNLYTLFVNDFILDDVKDLPVNPFTGEALQGSTAWPTINPGNPVWKDLNGDYVLSERDDQRLTTEFSPIPDIQGNFNINLQYKGWYLQAYSQFSFGADIYNTQGQRYFDQYDRRRSKWAERGLTDLSRYNFWQKPGDGAAGVDLPAIYPTALEDYSFYSFRSNQTLWLESGDYWRIANASVGYTFDRKQNFMKNLGLTRLRINATILNPYQWQRSKRVTNAAQVDAKGRTYGNGYPLPKTITIGINTRF